MAPWSPGRLPPEEAFAKVKHILRKICARTKEALIEAMGRALTAVSVQDARGVLRPLRLSHPGAPTMKGAVRL
jgi:hypothetical protein